MLRVLVASEIIWIGLRKLWLENLSTKYSHFTTQWWGNWFSFHLSEFFTQILTDSIDYNYRAAFELSEQAKSTVHWDSPGQPSAGTIEIPTKGMKKINGEIGLLHQGFRSFSRSKCHLSQRRMVRSLRTTLIQLSSMAVARIKKVFPPVCPLFLKYQKNRINYPTKKKSERKKSEWDNQNSTILKEFS